MKMEVEKEGRESEGREGSELHCARWFLSEAC
jgi:hypothetical protein